MQAVILAAGRGTRLKPLTDFRSKAMVPILDKPIVARVLNSIYLNGIRKFIIVVSLVDSTIKNYFYDNLPKDAEIQFVLQEVQNGTAGALEIAAPLIKEDFLVSACDSLYPSHVIGELISLFEKTNSDAVMAVMKASKETINKSSAITLNEKGEIITNEKTETNIEGLFAAGDVTNDFLKQAVVAAGDGAKAAFAAYLHLLKKRREGK